MKNKNIISFVLVIIFFAIGFFLVNQPDIKPENIQYVKIAGQNIKVDLALTPSGQAQGLSGRNPLREDEGMLFVFPQSGQNAFWMKDMNFAIDIIWLDEDRRVIYIKKDARPELFPETYGPEYPSKYVLEVVSGFSEKNNLQVGDRVEFLFSS